MVKDQLEQELERRVSRDARRSGETDGQMRPRGLSPLFIFGHGQRGRYPHTEPPIRSCGHLCRFAQFMETLGKAANRFSASVNALEVLQGEEAGGF